MWRDPTRLNDIALSATPEIDVVGNGKLQRMVTKRVVVALEGRLILPHGRPPLLRGLRRSGSEKLISGFS